jgi:hypothetical protein
MSLVEPVQVAGSAVAGWGRLSVASGMRGWFRQLMSCRSGWPGESSGMSARPRLAGGLSPRSMASHVSWDSQAAVVSELLIAAGDGSQLACHGGPAAVR